MVITAMTPMLGVSDIGRSLLFYRDFLGFTVKSTFGPGGRMTWASLRHGSVELMLSGHHGAMPGPEAAKAHGDAKLYLYVDDVTGLISRAKERGIKVEGPWVRFYGLKEIQITDPDGYGLVIAQETSEKPTPE
jgi:glyoxylase I family protein